MLFNRQIFTSSKKACTYKFHSKTVKSKVYAKRLDNGVRRERSVHGVIKRKGLFGEFYPVVLMKT
jgi:hypothetical protein